MKVFIEFHLQEDNSPFCVSVSAIMAISPDEDGAAIRTKDGDTVLFVSEDYKAIKAALVGTEEVHIVNFAK